MPCVITPSGHLLSLNVSIIPISFQYCFTKKSLVELKSGHSKSLTSCDHLLPYGFSGHLTPLCFCVVPWKVGVNTPQGHDFCFLADFHQNVKMKSLLSTLLACLVTFLLLE